MAVPAQLNGTISSTVSRQQEEVTPSIKLVIEQRKLPVVMVVMVVLAVAVAAKQILGREILKDQVVLWQGAVLSEVVASAWCVTTAGRLGT